MHLWIGWWRNMRYPQKFKIFGSYPFLHDSSDRVWPTSIAPFQVLDISAESEVIHRNSGDLLLPIIFIKNEKEQPERKPVWQTYAFLITDNCLSDIEKFFTVIDVVRRTPRGKPWYVTQHSMQTASWVVLAPKLMHRKLCTGVEGQQALLYRKMRNHSKIFNEWPSACQSTENSFVQSCENYFLVFLAFNHW